MSTRSAEVRSTPTPQAPYDLRTGTRWLLALLLPVGPACVAVLRYVLPYGTVGSASDTVDRAVAEVGAMSAVLWLGFVAILTLVPGVLAVGRLTRRRAPRTTAAGLVLAVPGYLCLTWLIGSDLLLWTGAQVGTDRADLISLYTTSHPTSTVAGVVFVLGHVVGTILLGVALWRSGAVARWAAVLVIVAQPLHFVAAVILQSPSLDLVAWGLNAVGFAAAALALTRLPNDEWDLAPQ